MSLLVIMSLNDKKSIHHVIKTESIGSEANLIAVVIKDHRYDYESKVRFSKGAISFMESKSLIETNATRNSFLLNEFKHSKD